MYTEYDSKGTEMDQDESYQENEFDNENDQEKKDRIKKIIIIILIILLLLFLGWVFFFSGWIGGKGKNVSSVSINMKNITIAPGDNYQLYASILPNDAKDRTVIWYSTDSSIASVNSKGLVYAEEEGNAIIVVKTNDGGKTAACSVTVSNDALAIESIEFTSKEITLYKGGTVLLEVKVNPEGAKTPKLIFESSNKDVVTVDENGFVTAVGVGEANVTATTEDGLHETAVKITVASGGGNAVAIIYPTSIGFASDTITIQVGSTENLNVNFNPSNATYRSLTWASLDNSIVAVNNGAITGIKVGVTEVVAITQNNLSARITVIVVESPIAVTSITPSTTAVNLNVGGTKQISYTILPNNATNKNVTYKSNDEKIATIDNSGLIRAIGVGTTTITLTTVDGGKTATIEVTVKKATSNNPGVPSDPKNPTISDTTKPTISVILSGTKGTNNWYKSNVSVRIVVADESDIDNVHYCVDNDCLESSQKDISLNSFTTNGTYQVMVDACDVKNNCSSVTETFKIDKTSPTGSISLTGSLSNGVYNSSVVAKFAFVDANSGVNSVKYCRVREDNTCLPSTSVDNNGTITINENGSFVIRAIVTDNAGNTNGYDKAFEIQIPVGVEIENSGVLGTNDWYTSNVTSTFNTNDPSSQITSIKYCISKGSDSACEPNISVLNGNSVMITDEGINIIHAKATTKSNKSISNAKTVKIDKTAPTCDINITVNNNTNGVSYFVSANDNIGADNAEIYTWSNFIVDQNVAFTGRKVTSQYYAIDAAGIRKTCKITISSSQSTTTSCPSGYSNIPSFSTTKCYKTAGAATWGNWEFSSSSVVQSLPSSYLTRSTSNTGIAYEYTAIESSATCKLASEGAITSGPCYQKTIYNRSRVCPTGAVLKSNSCYYESDMVTTNVVKYVGTVE